ncbi:alpha/beta hydrolase [Candidatus Methylacidiphilum infernorum]|uniref:Alpha/beta superfamily hydrolase n=1 Tax=Methylacidiphilum infernorum (isolate V4) TaxID=481448 RepID=B3DX04_METI4|nr:alpha/beta fold hydrolase [Candidatus Methylacidiphilum infernorum]ACD82144.1 alpha/beta superfamily hydrolase [Methylacidiphilum infernorum V4]
MNHSIPSEIRNAHGERLDFIYTPGSADNNTLIIIAHGITAHKDRPMLVTLTNYLAKNGIHSLRFSFSGHGKSEGKFEEFTPTKEVGDLQSVFNALPGWTKYGYVGHSLGAAVGVLFASQDPRVSFLISLAGMAYTAAFAEREFGTVTPGQGYMWDMPEFPLSKVLIEDMNRIDNVKEAAKKIKLPWLFIHGLADDVVPPQDSRDLFAIASGPKKLVEIPGCDHLFPPPHDSFMAETVVNWLKELQLIS